MCRNDEKEEISNAMEVKDGANSSLSIESSSTMENMFRKPLVAGIDGFFYFHSKPPDEQVSFNVEKACTSATSTGIVVQRHWLTFNNLRNSLHCSICLAYSNKSSVFINGLADFKHIYDRINEHEASTMHSLSAKAFLLRKSKANNVELLDSNAVDIRRKKIEKKREVLKKIAQIVAVLGKQGLAFSGKRHKGAHEINDPTVNHGNFIKIVK